MNACKTGAPQTDVKCLYELMTPESSGCLTQSGSEVALAAVSAPLWSRSSASSGTGCWWLHTDPSMGNALIIDFTDVLMVGWEGEICVEVWNLSGACAE